MYVRNINLKRDYEILQKWASSYDCKLPSIDLLPNTGKIVDGHAAIFLYETNSKLCLLECLIANKEVEKKDKDKAIDLVIEHAILDAKFKQFSTVFLSTHNIMVEDRFKKHGFTVINKDMTYLMRVL